MPRTRQPADAAPPLPPTVKVPPEPMLDLLVHHATLPDGRTDMSVAVQDGRITEVTQGLTPGQAPAHQTIDAEGLLLSPPFVDPHFHMDATLSYGLPRVNESGTLLEGIALWGELKPTLQGRRDHRTRVDLLRLGGGQRTACDPHPCRHQRCEPARGRCAAGGEEASRALPRSAIGRIPAGRRLAVCGRRGQPKARTRPRRRCRRRHPPLRAHDERGRRQRQAAVRDRGRARLARRHALRRVRRSAVAPHRNAGL